MVQIIVQHTPKCAGASLRQMMLATFGKNQVFSDYQDKIANPLSVFNLDPDRYWREARSKNPHHAVIFGHFPMRKYAHVARALRVATIRHPVERAISHFHYWLSGRPIEAHPVLEYVKRNRLDLRAFARLPLVRNFYRSFYFSDCSSADFDLIIFQERFDEGVAALAAMTGREFSMLNIHANRTPSPAIDQGVENDIREILAEETAFYEAVESWPAAKSRLHLK